MRTKLIKAISPDFFLGKTLVSIKAIFDILVMVVRNPSKQSLKFANVILKVKPKYTMVRNKNLISLYNLVRRANALNLSGDIVECGVWNGGSAAVMGVACMEDEHCSKKRNLWLFDSFEGLPLPGELDGNIERKSYTEGWNRGDIGKVKMVFHKLGLPLENVRIIPGWFDVTLRAAPINTIAVLHIDADWYDSVKVTLEIFYDRVVPGGFIVLDDYGYWHGCERALADYFAEHQIENIAIKQVDRVGGYFQKP